MSYFSSVLLIVRGGKALLVKTNGLLADGFEVDILNRLMVGTGAFRDELLSGLADVGVETASKALCRPR